MSGTDVPPALARVLATMPDALRALVPARLEIQGAEGMGDEELRRLMGNAVRGLPIYGEAATPKPIASNRHPELGRPGRRLTVRRTVVRPEGTIALEFEELPGRLYAASFFSTRPLREELKAVVVQADDGEVWAVALHGDNMGGDTKVPGRAIRLAPEVRMAVDMDLGSEGGGAQRLVGWKASLLLTPLADGDRRVDAVFDRRPAESREVVLARRSLPKDEF